MSILTNAFIRKKDYDTHIRQDVLDVVISDDPSILDTSESRAIETVQSFLRPKYDVDKIFTLSGYSSTQTYSVGDYVDYSETAWASGTTYTLNDRVSYSGSNGDYIYQSSITGNTGNTPETSPSEWGQVVKNETVFTSLSGHTGSKPLAVSNVWEQKDSRNQTVLGWIIDLTLYELHSRINPRNIPEFRLVRWDEAMTSLNEIQENKRDLDLPRVAIPASGTTQYNLLFQWGSEPKFRYGTNRPNSSTNQLI